MPPFLSIFCSLLCVHEIITTEILLTQTFFFFARVTPSGSSCQKMNERITGTKRIPTYIAQLRDRFFVIGNLVTIAERSQSIPHCVCYQDVQVSPFNCVTHSNHFGLSARVLHPLQLSPTLLQDLFLPTPSQLPLSS